ncbi:MAG: DUF2207 domain-containing protein [Christensenellales bacterium]
MKKFLGFLFTAAALWCFLAVPPVAKAAGPEITYDNTYRYFESYDVKIKVQENNVLDITETIVADYSVLKVPGHGIIREIPTQLDFTLPNGTRRNYKVVLSDVSVAGHKVSSSSNGSYRVLKIGDPNAFAEGKVTYVIQYRYDIGDDYYDVSDFLYYNVIGTEWNADIASASFSVEMPKPFNADDAVAYAGGYGYNDPVKIQISGNTISGSAHDLEQYEGITLIVDLPEGYFTGERVGPPYMTALYVFFVLIVSVSFILFLLFGRDGHVVETVEFNAPDNLTPAEVGYVIDGCVDNKDITSLIIYWADKGYLSLSEEKKHDLRITKLRELPENAMFFEKTMFDDLFKKGDSVSVSSLKNTFYTTMESTKTAVKNSFIGRDIFTSLSMKLQGLLGFLTALPIVLSFFLTIWYDSGDFTTPIFVSIFALGLILGPVYALISLIKCWRSLENKKRVARLVGSVVLLGIAFAVYLVFMGFVFDFLLLGVASVAATMVTAVCTMFIRKRTTYGASLLGKILGFKNFMEKAEKDRIEKLIEANPNYFYSVLPYAYVLGVTEKWAENFEKIGIQPPPPAWYAGYGSGNLFSAMVFMHMINSSMNTMNSSFVARPTPQGGTRGGFGGGFGGGGFSGGGFGGGGGGGW